MIFHENRLPADDSHEISCPILLVKADLWESVIVLFLLYVTLYPF